MKYDVFISYSRKDFNEVNALISRLETCLPQLNLWFDITGIESGEEFQDKIISAIDNSSYILFAISDNSLASSWTKDEVMYAKNTNKKIIPILLKNGCLKGWFLFTFGRIDCIDSTNELQFNKLIDNLSKWINIDTSGSSCKISDELKNTIKLAELGVPEAQYHLGLSYFSNTDFESGANFIKDYKQAVKWYTKAAEQGHVQAQVQLGICYKNGLGVNIDHSTAQYWWRKAADQGDENAIKLVGRDISLKNNTIFQLVLNKVGSSNLSAVKIIHQVLNIKLVEAKNIVDKIPAILLESSYKYDVLELKAKIENNIAYNHNIELEIREVSIRTD